MPLTITINEAAPGTLTIGVGTPGVGVPAGGTAGQVLTKVNSTDYNTVFATPSADYITAVTAPLSVTSGNLSVNLSTYLTTATAATTYYLQTNPAQYQTVGDLSSALAPYLLSATAATTYYPLVGNPSGFLTSAPVTSVAGMTGAVLLANTDISGLGTLSVVNDAPSDGSQYARKNAAWDVVISGDRYLTASTTSNTIGNGNKTFTIGTGLSYTPTQNITISYDASNHMHGEVLTYNSGTGVLTVDINHHTGSGTYTAWVVNVGGVTPATSVAWGAITGTLSSQTDLQSALDLKSNLASPTFTGSPLSTTAAADTNTTQISTTAFVIGQASSTTPAATGTAAVGTSLKYARADHVHANPLPPNGTTAQVLSKIDGTSYNVQWVTPSGGGGGTDYQAYTTPGTYTWTKPAGAKWVEIYMFGGGGGGGSGARLATSSARGSGSSGSGGTFLLTTVAAAALGATETVVVGAGGTGGVPRTTDNGLGNNGTAGGNSTFSIFTAIGGGIGAGGTNASVAAPAGRGGYLNGVTGNLTPNGAAGSIGTGTNGPSTLGAVSFVSTPGGSGGGAAAASTASAAGGNGGNKTGFSNTAGISGVAGGSGGTVGGTPPTPGVAGSGLRGGGTGGGGGAYITAVAGMAGAAGGAAGGGGGSGAASDNGFPSGAGGNGGSGVVYIITSC